MKKLAILLLALTLLCTCFVLAACGDGDGDSSAADSSSTEATSSEATSSKEEAPTSSEAVIEETSEPDEPSDPETSEPTEEQPVEGEAKLFWLTHYNTLGNEGSGVIMSAEYTGGDWWFHSSFKPVDGEDGVYEVVEVLDGTDGTGHPLDIPEGGFVYALHTGNNYEGGIDYTTVAGNDMLNDARTWKAGDKFTFTGIDFENFTEVPTETPDLNWYEDGDNGTGNYVCTATYTKVG